MVEEEVQKGKGEGKLDINRFDLECMNHTYYEFRLGSTYRRWSEDNGKNLGELSPGREILDIKPGEFILVQSHEMFRCSQDVMGMIGSSTSLVKKGLSLEHSPFIDPRFPGDDVGVLEVAIKNELPVSRRLTFRDVIGKISFYDVSDTYPVDEISGASRRRIDRRKRGYALDRYDNDPRPGWKDIEDE